MTPPGKPPRHGRHQTQTERDLDGMHARRERDQAVPFHAEADITGRYEGEELDEMREGREPRERVAHLEKKHDKLAAEVVEIRVSHAGLKSSIDTLLTFASKSDAERERRHKQEADERTAADKRKTEEDKRKADEAERRRKNLPLVISAIGIAIAGIVAAAIHGCA